MGKDLRLLDQFYDYGARYFGLIHMGHNDLGDSSVPNARTNEATEEHGGLTDLGRQVVHRLNELGIMVDVSHSSKADHSGYDCGIRGPCDRITFQPQGYL